MIPGNAVLSPSFVFQKKKNRINKNELYKSARQALFVGLSKMDLTDKTVWLPAYNCNSVLYPIKKLGLNYRFYEITEDFLPNFETIENNENDLILIVHYFGIVGDIEALKRKCSEKKLSIVEDCAHFLPSEDSEAGKMGIFSIFSLRKQLPVPDGGILQFNNRQLEEIKKTATAASFKKLILMIIESVCFKFQFNFIRLKDRLRGKVKTTEEFFAQRDFKKMNDASGLTKFIFRKQGIKKIKQQRISNFNLLSELLLSNTKTKLPVKRISSESMPMALPIFSANGLMMKDFLRKKGIGVDSWPGDAISDEISLDSFPITKKISDTILLLPIHQSLQEKHLKKIARAIKKYEHVG
jgi:dTDP-4-amino-4,6-dideoxygalactose transaminase